MRIYVAGRLSSKESVDRSPSKIVIDYIQNIHDMCQAASAIMRKGHAPYIPGIDFLAGVVDGHWEEDDYRNISYEFLTVCHAFVAISDSWGVQKELRLASELGLVIYDSVDDIPQKEEP